MVILIILAFLVTRSLVKFFMMALSTILLYLSLKRKYLLNELMHFNIPLNSFRGIAIIVGTAVLIYLGETSIWSLRTIVTDYPTIGLPAQIFLWLSFSHLISYATHGLLFIFLWHKWKRFLPAFLTVLFEISLSEFGFAGPQWYQFGFIFVWTWGWYVGFILVCIPFIVLRENFDLSDKRLWLTFAFGVAVLFVNAFFGFKDPWTWDNVTHSFHLFPEFIYEPTAWYNMYINRVGKILMTSAFVFVKLKNQPLIHDCHELSAVTCAAKSDATLPDALHSLRAK